MLNTTGQFDSGWKSLFELGVGTRKGPDYAGAAGAGRASPFGVGPRIVLGPLLVENQDKAPKSSGVLAIACARIKHLSMCK